MLSLTHTCTQDLDYDAAVPIYVNRVFLVEYLHQSVFAKGNILEDFLYTACRTLQFVAMSRANAIIDLRISKPMRWLAGKLPSCKSGRPTRTSWFSTLCTKPSSGLRTAGNLLLFPDLRVFGSRG